MGKVVARVERERERESYNLRKKMEEKRQKEVAEKAYNNMTK